MTGVGVATSSKTQEALALMALAMLVTNAAVAADDASPSCPRLTLHNLCPYPVWPLVTANAGYPSVAGTDSRLNGNGEGLVTMALPQGAWSGRVVARTGCADDGMSCDDNCSPQCKTGNTPPVTVAQVSVGGSGGLAEYSVSLVDGFNVPMVVTPCDFAAGAQCPTLGCAVDLTQDQECCPAAGARAPEGGCGAAGTEAALFKNRCPDTRTTSTDVEATPQNCIAPGELKVVFCPARDCPPSCN